MASAATSYPLPTPIFRIIHLDTLPVLLARGALHAPNNQPQDGRVCVRIDYESVQQQRQTHSIACGGGARTHGVIHDYIPFYFNSRSPMLYAIHMGKLSASCPNGQRDIVILETTCQAVAAIPRPFVFSDGHGIVRYTSWFDSLNDLDKIDWALMKAKYWVGTADDSESRRRRQAEFLVYKELPFTAIARLGVSDQASKLRVEAMLSQTKASTPVELLTRYYF